MPTIIPITTIEIMGHSLPLIDHVPSGRLLSIFECFLPSYKYVICPVLRDELCSGFGLFFITTMINSQACRHCKEGWFIYLRVMENQEPYHLVLVRTSW